MSVPRLRDVDPDVVCVHGRVALALLAAEYVLPLLRTHAAAEQVFTTMIEADWSWMETRQPSPSVLYWDYMPALMEIDSELAAGTHLSRVLHCGLYAHSYAIWSAEGVTDLEDPATVLSIGNDIADADEDCGLNAHSYAIWSAEGVTDFEDPATVLSIGNDIADADEDYLKCCLDLCCQAAPRAAATTEWLNQLIGRMERVQHKRADDLIGPRLSRREFLLPGL